MYIILYVLWDVYQLNMQKLVYTTEDHRWNSTAPVWCENHQYNCFAFDRRLPAHMH